MVDTWSSKPFVSYDGPDNNGVRAEVKVVTGYGKVYDTSKSDKGKSENVIFVVENTKYKPSGWTPDSAVAKIVHEAKDSGEPIHFRIETHRKEGVDRTKSIQELASTADSARDNAFKSLAAVKREGDAEWTISSFARTRLDEDPAPGGTNSAYQYSLEELQKMKQGANSASGGSAAVAEDPRDISSEACRQPLLTYEWIAKYFEETGLNDLAGEKERFQATQRVLHAAGRVQVEMVENLSKSNMGDKSFVRARETVCMITKLFFPLSAEALRDKESFTSWEEAVVDKAVKMWRWSVKEATSTLD